MTNLGSDSELEEPSVLHTVRQKTHGQSSYRRKWSAGSKFNEEDVDEVLPNPSFKWRSFPLRRAKTVEFAPRESNTPIGYCLEGGAKSLLEVRA